MDWLFGPASGWDSYHQVFWGAVGAAAPQIVGLYWLVVKVAQGRATFALPKAYVIVALPVLFLLFVGFGGLFALGLNSQSALNAMYIGATFQLILAGWAGGDPPRTSAFVPAGLTLPSSGVGGAPDPVDPRN